MMLKLDEYIASVFWSPRGESVESLAARCLHMTRALNRIDAIAGQWNFLNKACQTPQPIEEIQDELPALIAAAPSETMADGSTCLAYGYNMATSLRYTGDPREIFVKITAGAAGPGIFFGGRFSNDAILSTVDRRHGTTDPAIPTYENFRHILLALVESWKPSYGEMYPDDLREHWTEKAPTRPCWMNFLAPELISRLGDLPTSLETEHLSNGGLLLIATRDWFDLNNPDHLAAALALEKVLEPVLTSLPRG